jgi:phage terminase
MTNTTNAITSAQTIAVSNAGEAKSEVLRSLRAKGIEEIQAWETAQAKGTEYSPADPSLALFEYSAPDDCDIFDRKAWAMANPSLGYPHGPSEETLAARAALVGKPGEGMPEHKFRTENLCQWVNVAEDSLFKEEDLLECLDPDSEPAQESPIYISVDVSDDRRMSTISLAAWREDGLPHVEVLAQRPNTEWIPAFLAEKLTFEPAAVIIQGRGAPASSLIDYIEAAGTAVLKCEGTALTNAYAQFYDRVIDHSIRWRDQPALTLALGEIQVKSMGDAFVFNRSKSPIDIAPACAAAFALWGLTSQKAPEKKTSAYAGDYEDWYTADQTEDGGKWW